MTPKDETCLAEINIRIVSATAAMARLYRIWRCNTISFAGKFKLYKSLVTSILFYDCETWTLLAHSEKKRKIQAFETKCLRELLLISYSEHQTNDWNRVWQPSRDRILHGSRLSHASTASSRPSSFRAPWRVGDAVVGRGNAGWTTSSLPCQNC